MPDCEPRCSTQAISGVSITATSCYLNDVEVRCSEPAKPATVARINCRDRYERVNTYVKQHIISCGDDGIWSPSPEPCSPICGEEAPKGAYSLIDTKSFDLITLFLKLFAIHSFFSINRNSIRCWWFQCQHYTSAMACWNL